MTLAELNIILVVAATLLMVIGFVVHAALAWAFDPRPWEYGKLHNGLARRHRRTGAVQIILHEKGTKVRDYIYKGDWWFNTHSDHWGDFEPYLDTNLDI